MEGVAYGGNQTCGYLLTVLTKPFNWVGKLMTFYSKNVFSLNLSQLRIFLIAFFNNRNRKTI